LSYGVEKYNYKNITLEELEDVFVSIKNIIKHAPHKYQVKLIDERDNPWDLHSDNVQNILNYFENTDYFKIQQSRHPSESKYKTETYYLLPQSLKTMVLLPLKLPRIIKPQENIDVDTLLKPVMYGYGNFTRSENFKRILNYSRTKKYGISATFLKLTTDILDPTSWISN